MPAGDDVSSTDRFNFLSSQLKKYSEASNELSEAIHSKVENDKSIADTQEKLQKMSEELNKLSEQIAPGFKDASYILNYVSLFPIVLHTLAAMFCMGCSAAFHLYSAASENVSQVLARLDYGGISVLVFGSCFSVIQYTFACDGALSKFFS